MQAVEEARIPQDVVVIDNNMENLQRAIDRGYLAIYCDNEKGLKLTNLKPVKTLERVEMDGTKHRVAASMAHSR